MFYGLYATAILLLAFASNVMACSVTPEFSRLSVTQQAEWLYNRVPVVARVRVKNIASTPPHIAQVETIESFKGPELSAVYKDLSTCGFELTKDQDFIAFLPSDRAVVSLHTMIPSSEYDQVLPTLRKLRNTK